MKAGPGRPRAPRPPRNEHQAALAVAVETAEAERDAAATAYRATPTVAAELALLQAEMSAASAWGAYCRAQGNMTHGLRFGDVTAKYAGRIAALRELAAVDQLDKLVARSQREDALAGKAGR